jgi:hypothetical protein
MWRAPGVGVRIVGGFLNGARSASDGCVLRAERAPRACAWGSDRFPHSGTLIAVAHPQHCAVTDKLDAHPCAGGEARIDENHSRQVAI